MVSHNQGRKLFINENYETQHVNNVDEWQERDFLVRRENFPLLISNHPRQKEKNSREFGLIEFIHGANEARGFDPSSEY